MNQVQKNITIFIWISAIVNTGVAYLNHYPIEQFILLVGGMFCGAIIATILYFVRIPIRVKALFILLMGGIGGLLSSVTIGGDIGITQVSIVSLGYAFMYFEPKILSIYSVMYLATVAILYFIKPVYIVGSATSTYFGIFLLFTFSFISICFYIGTKAGYGYMQKAKDDEKEAQEKLIMIEQMASVAKTLVYSLSNNISESEQTVQLLAEKANQVNLSITDLERYESDTIDTFAKLQEEIKTSTQWIEDNYKLIHVLEQNFSDALQNVEDSKEFSRNAAQALNDIKVTIEHACECIKKSAKDTEEISNIVSDIDELSSNTNLLALNASIEAARVGDHGKGFDIVAEQIRKLSIQNGKASENIRYILEGLSGALTTTELKVNRGLEAIHQGIGNLGMIVKGLEMIDFYSYQSQSMLASEVEVFEQIKSEFSVMVDEVEKNMIMASDNMNELQSVSNSTQLQNRKTAMILDKLKEMEELATHITQNFA